MKVIITSFSTKAGEPYWVGEAKIIAEEKEIENIFKEKKKIKKIKEKIAKAFIEKLLEE